MSDQEVILLIEVTLKDKMIKDPECIRYTFYELRLDLNLTEDETNHFLRLASIKLANMGYNVYFTGDQYVLGKRSKIVEKNELIVAIKNSNL